MARLRPRRAGRCPGPPAVDRPGQARAAGAGHGQRRAPVAARRAAQRPRPRRARRSSTRRSPRIARAAVRCLPRAICRLAATGARWSLARDRRADRPRSPARRCTARPGCRSPSSCWSRPSFRSRSDPTRGCSAGSAAGRLWIAALTAALLPIERLVEPDRADGVLDQLALAGIAEEAIGAAKIDRPLADLRAAAAARGGSRQLPGRARRRRRWRAASSRWPSARRRWRRWRWPSRR